MTGGLCIALLAMLISAGLMVEGVVWIGRKWRRMLDATLPPGKVTNQRGCGCPSCRRNRRSFAEPCSDYDGG